jgi:SAM-dependent methyltransferase
MRKASSLDLHRDEDKSHQWLLPLKEKLSDIKIWVKERIRRAPSAPAYYWRRLKGFRAKAVGSQGGSTERRSGQQPDYFLGESEELPIVPNNLNTGLCGLAGPGKYSNAEWRMIHSELEEYSIDKHVFSPHVYRKGWEWTQAVYGLEKLGMIKPDYSALGIGAGRECVIFWFGAHLREVIATDLYGNEEWNRNWGKEADPGVLTDPQKYCPKKMDMSNIRFLTMDGTKLEFEDEKFNIAWSLSSIEHFGGHKQAAQAMREMARVTKRGGIVVVATEYLLLEEYTHPDFFNKKDLLEFVVNASPQLELVEPIDFSLPPSEYLVDSIIIPNGVHRRRRHVVLNDGRVQWTSIIVFLRKR